MQFSKPICDFFFAAVFAIVGTQAAVSCSQIYESKDALLQLIEVVEVPAAVSGKLTEVSVQVGSKVEVGQPLAKIDDRLARLQLEAAESELGIARRQSTSRVEINFAEKSLAVSMADLRRAEKSNKSFKNVVPPQEMDRLRLVVEQSTAEIEKLTFDKEVLRLNVALKETTKRQRALEVERHQIRADIKGLITEVKKEQGEWVDASQPVFKIVRTDRLRIEEYIPVSEVVPELDGATVSFLPTNAKHVSERSFAGKVVFVSPEVNPLNSKVKIWIEIGNAESLLRPGIKGQLSIHASSTP